jgi:hypothetical protein
MLPVAFALSSGDLVAFLAPPFRTVADAAGEDAKFRWRNPGSRARMAW